ncbi:MAG: sulfatase-like hydrolase/transferase [Verrucomicrobiae bacterium]|nr:sulfatase-like hydrolase/transferase [Verrucomicrobiae bacterium]
MRIALRQLILLLSASCITATAAPKYNLLVIQTDEHNYRTLSCYRQLLPEGDYYRGTKVLETPNIDWIAKNGALCTSFYATTPVCSPSRAALVSGRYPQNTDVVSNDIPLNDSIVTFAEILRREGYATGYAGKWHLDGTGKPQWAPKRNFGFSDNRFMFNRGHWKMFNDTPDGPRVASTDKRGQPDYGLDGADDKTFATDWLADKTIGFINANKSAPFCYMVSFPDPHGPNTVRSPYDTLYKAAKVPTPDSTLNKTPQQTPPWAALTPRLTADTVRTIMPKYYGMVKCLDDNIGRILETLRTNGQIDRTVIAFTSDHGDLCGEHGRLNKGVPYEGSARIPFLLYFPGRVKPGTIVNEALSCVDFLPTIMSLLRVKTAGKEQGRDASRLFTGKDPRWNDIAFVRSTGSGPGWVMAVSDKLKLVFASRGKPWLFDLNADPDELDNRIDIPRYREDVRRLSKALRDYGVQQNDESVLSPKIQADLDWAIGTEIAYRDVQATSPGPQGGKSKKRKRKE